VVGKLRLSECTGRDGERRSRVQVVADAVQFPGAPAKNTAEPADDTDEPADRPMGRPPVGWPPRGLRWAPALPCRGR
jgi:hypothetical protein